MSWVTKWLGLDKHPEERDAINAALRGIFAPDWARAKETFFLKAGALKIDGASAAILWGNLCEALKVPREMR